MLMKTFTSLILHHRTSNSTLPQWYKLSIIGASPKTSRTYCMNRTMDDEQKCSLYSLVFHINEVVSVIKKCIEGYDLSKFYLLGLQNSILSGRYHFAPLRLVIETEDTHSPWSNSKPYLSVVPSNTEDHVVIGALGALLVQELKRSTYLSKSCISTYKGKDYLYTYHSTILEWRGVEALLRLNCSKSYITYPRSRLLEKVKTLLNNEQVVDLIKCFCNLSIIDNMDRVHSLNTCFPPMIFIGEIRLNRILDDIDQEMAKRLPKQNYARLQHEILIPIFGEDKDGLYNTTLDEIFHQCNFMPPEIKRAVRGGDPIPFSGGLIHINEDGEISIKR